jgi:hypothetical protein
LKFAPFFLLVFFTYFTVLGQNEVESVDGFLSSEQSLQNIETQDDSLPRNLEENENAQEISLDLPGATVFRDSISLGSQEKKVKNHRYIVISAVMMMLFVGFCMASVSSLNPE